MPVCFQLYPIGSQEPAILQKVDDAMRVHFQQPADPDHWLGGWYNWIGFSLATGHSWDDLRQEMREVIAKPIDDKHKDWAEGQLLIIDWLAANYTPNHWREIGRS